MSKFNIELVLSSFNGKQNYDFTVDGETVSINEDKFFIEGFHDANLVGVEYPAKGWKKETFLISQEQLSYLQI